MKNLIKSILITCVLTLLIFTQSCGSDGESGPSYAFIDQNLQGSINGIPFVYAEGTVELTGSGDRLSFDLYDTDEIFDDVCAVFGFGEEVSVFFTGANEVGLYELSLESNTVTLFDPSETLNVIASIGAVEILTITSTEVTGRIDARLDAGSTINGNFTVVFCEE